jgi:ligand-binding sensor domain-containing protein
MRGFRGLICYRRCFIVSTAILVLIVETHIEVMAQNIALGTWRTHLSYHHISAIAFGDQMAFASGNLGVMLMDQSDNSVSTYSKINGLNGTSVSHIDYDDHNKQLLITYTDGRFDVVTEESEIVGFDPTKNSTVTGSKKINHAFIAGGIAYLSADYGVIVFDMNRMSVKETWRGLGGAGQTLMVFQSTILGDSIFLATGKGVIAGALKDNLQDFNSWKRFESGELNGPVQHVTNFNNTIYSGVNTSGIFKYMGALWVKTPFLQGSSFKSMNSPGANLYVADENGLFRITVSDEVVQIEDRLIERPNFATEDSNGKVWIGDGKNGLVTNASGSFVSTIPNSPSGDKTFEITYFDKTIYALAGGYSSNAVAFGNPGSIDSFRDGLWLNEESGLSDLTAIAFDKNSDKVFISSFGYGVEARDSQGNSIVFNENNSPLVNINPPGAFVNIPSLAAGTDGIWITNYGSPKPLHFLGADDTWKSFSFPFEQSKYPLNVAVDFNGSVWLALDPSEGGGILVFNEKDNSSVILTDATGSGGLPSNTINSITIDKDGAVWIGADFGVAYFNEPLSVFSGNVNAIKPIFDGRFLLRDDDVTAIAVDGGNRKWIGTERGLWLFNESGEVLIHNFTTTNSPLLSNVVRDVEVNGETGEVFVATEQGLLSYRSDATDSKSEFGAVKVFPNPVTADFVGSIGITGLATDALVKITDINGKLVWQTRANGGSASWNLQDVNGRRPSTGVYIVFAVTDDGHDSAVAKIAFVD